MNDQLRIAGFALLCGGVVLLLGALFAGPFGLVEFQSPLRGGQLLLETIGLTMILIGFLIVWRQR